MEYRYAGFWCIRYGHHRLTSGTLRTPRVPLAVATHRPSVSTRVTLTEGLALPPGVTLYVTTPTTNNYLLILMHEQCILFFTTYPISDEGNLESIHRDLGRKAGDNMDEVSPIVRNNHTHIYILRTIKICQSAYNATPNLRSVRQTG